MYYSPLRYPGGKSKLKSLIELLIKQTGHVGGTYIEPFAGGAAIALELLEKDLVDKIVINDLDKGVYSFWRAILCETNRFINDVQTVDLSIEEWKKQRNIVETKARNYSYDLGFATFYLNRTNRSGIIKGGVIGGVHQNGIWKMDARFNRDNLVRRIVGIAKKRNKIHLYNKDVLSFITRYLTKYEDNAFIYFDPPYYSKGKQLYLNYFTAKDHARIEAYIRTNVKCDWVITYDDVPQIAELYKNHIMRKFSINYSAGIKRKASEIIVFKDASIVPSEEQLKQECKEFELRQFL